MYAIGKKLWLRVKITQQRLGSSRAGNWGDMTPESTWPVLTTHWGRGKAALIDTIVSLKMVFHGWIPDLLLFWELSFFSEREEILKDLLPQL